MKRVFGFKRIGGYGLVSLCGCMTVSSILSMSRLQKSALPMWGVSGYEQHL